LRLRGAKYDTDPARLTEEVEKILEDLLSLCPTDAATLTRAPDPDAVVEAVIYSIRPKRADAAPIEVSVANHDEIIDLWVGDATGLEIDVTLKGWRDIGNDFRSELRALCLAVIDGRFDEEYWLHENEIVRSISRFATPDKTVVARRSRFLAVTPKEATHVKRTYKSYC
jgi:hypothetical protein